MVESQPNVYREGKQLVVPIEGAVFPKRCVKTNAELEAADYRLVLDLLPAQIHGPPTAIQQVAELAAVLLHPAARVLELAGKRRLRFTVGLSPQRQASNRRNKRCGLLLVIVGPLLGVVLGAILANNFPNQDGSPLLVAPLVGLAAAVLVMLAGIVLFGVGSMAIVRVSRSDGRHVWLDGAGSDFLASLPQSR